MILYHGSNMEIIKPNLQICFRSQKVINQYLKFKGSEKV